VRGVGCGEHDRPCRHALLGQAVMHIAERQTFTFTLPLTIEQRSP
jgi:hypothetical protein